MHLPTSPDPAGATDAASLRASRENAIDAVRGLAVLGILLLNIVSFGLPGAAYVNPAVAGGATGADLWTWAASYVLVEGKMRALFSMLFGASMLLVAERTTGRTPGPAGVHYRRMAVLFLFGMAHAWLIWYGDILTYYAIVGAIVFAARKLSIRWLAGLGVALLLAQGALSHGEGRRLESVRAAAEAPAATEAERARWAQERTSYVPAPEEIAAETRGYLGGMAEVFATRAPTTREFQLFLFPIAFFLEISGMMLIGMALLKSGWILGRRSAAHYASVAAAGFAIGVPVFVALAHMQMAGGWEGDVYLRAEGVSVVARVPLALAWAALVLWAWRRLGETSLPLLRAAGRMALTNYLMASILMTTLFYGYGLGLFGSLSRWQLALLVVPAVWVLQLLWSKPWLERHHFGPFEWLWRTLARGQVQPWRRAELAPA
jgi:uncharacterized protein